MAGDVSEAGDGPAEPTTGASPPRPKRVLTVFTLVMITTGIITSLQGAPSMAEFGFGSLFIYLAVAVVFLIPSALISAELATGWPADGGVYVWVREAFGERWGFLAVWQQWSENAIWFPSILQVTVITAAFAFDPDLQNDKVYVFVSVNVVFWSLTLLNLLVPKVIANAIDQGLASGQATALYVAAAIILAIALVRALAGFGQRYFGEWLTYRVAYDLRNEFYDSVQQLPFAFHDKAHTGDLMSRATGDISETERFVGVHHPARQGQFLGPLQPDDPGQEPGAAEVHRQTPADEDLREPGPVGGDDDVAAECHVHTRSHRHPVDGGDGRLGDPVQGGGRPLHHLHPAVAVGHRHGAPEPCQVEIGPGAELTRGPGDHQHPVVAVLEVDERLGEEGPAVGGNGVLPIRAVDRQPTHLPFGLDVEPGHVGDSRHQPGAVTVPVWVSIRSGSMTRAPST